MTSTKPVEQSRREMIAAGPWIQGREVYGQFCQLCRLPIYSVREAYIREGDELSPALYRHPQCHEDAVRFSK